MRSVAPALLPVFRSSAQARLLAILLLRSDEEHTLTDLSRHTGAPLSTVHDEVARLVRAGILAERAVGRARLLRANGDNPAVRPLTELVALTFGPITVIEEEFADLPGVHKVILFGSWAERYLGAPGPPPRDVDVLVVGSTGRKALYAAADRAEKRLGRPVHPVLATPERFEANADPLLRQINGSPAITVVDRAAEESA